MHLIRLPREKDARFPNICVVCLLDNPNDVLWFSVPTWRQAVGTPLAWLWPDAAVWLPICSDCKRRLILDRSLRNVLKWVLLIGTMLAVFYPLSFFLSGAWSIAVALVVTVVVISASTHVQSYAVPPAFDMLVSGDVIDYRFRDETYSGQFYYRSMDMNGPSNAELEDWDDASLVVDLVDRIRPRYDEGGLEALNEPERIILAVYDLYSYVCNGGFGKWIYDIGGDLAPGTATYLEAIGDPKVAGLVGQILAEFGDEGLLDYSLRMDQFSAVEDTLDETIVRCDVAFRDLDESMHKLLCIFARSHITEIRLPSPEVPLYLDGSQLKSLPPGIGKFTHLTTLDLHDNQLTTLPPEIGDLAKLTTLDLRANQLASLTREIEKLTGLRVLNITGNKLSDEDIERLKRAMPQCEIRHD
jgi:hypothetical protein